MSAVSDNPVSAALDRLLVETGLTQAELAKRLDLPRSSISRLFSESYQGHSVASLRRIAEAAGAELEIRFRL